MMRNEFNLEPEVGVKENVSQSILSCMNNEKMSLRGLFYDESNILRSSVTVKLPTMKAQSSRDDENKIYNIIVTFLFYFSYEWGQITLLLVTDQCSIVPVLI